MLPCQALTEVVAFAGLTTVLVVLFLLRVKIPVNVKVAKQSKTVGGWVLCIQGRPTLAAHKSKAATVQEAVDFLKSLRIEVKPIMQLGYKNKK